MYVGGSTLFNCSCCIFGGNFSDVVDLEVLYLNARGGDVVIGSTCGVGS